MLILHRFQRLPPSMRTLLDGIMSTDSNVREGHRRGTEPGHIHRGHVLGENGGRCTRGCWPHGEFFVEIPSTQVTLSLSQPTYESERMRTEQLFANALPTTQTRHPRPSRGGQVVLRRDHPSKPALAFVRPWTNRIWTAGIFK